MQEDDNTKTSWYTTSCSFSSSPSSSNSEVRWAKFDLNCSKEANKGLSPYLFTFHKLLFFKHIRFILGASTFEMVLGPSDPTRSFSALERVVTKLFANGTLNQFTAAILMARINLFTLRAVSLPLL